MIGFRLLLQMFGVRSELALAFLDDSSGDNDNVSVANFLHGGFLQLVGTVDDDALETIFRKFFPFIIPLLNKSWRDDNQGCS